MNANVTTNKTKNSSFKSLRVKEKTKKKTSELLKKINKHRRSGKVTCDALIDFFIENVTPSDLEKLELSLLTWDIEGERIRAIFEDINGVVSDSLWTQFIQTDDYRNFAMEHSRLPLPWDQPLEMYATKSRKKTLTKTNKNVSLRERSA